MDAPISHQDAGNDGEKKDPIIPVPSISQSNDDKCTQSRGTYKQIRQPKRDNAIAKRLRELRSASIDRQIELGLGLIVVFFAGAQVINSCSTSEQTERLISAAQRSERAATKSSTAAWSFAHSATQINNGVGEAVGKLNLQAGQLARNAAQTERLANETDMANANAKKSFEFQTHPWVGIENPTAVPATIAYRWTVPMPYPTIDVTLNFSIKNYGSSPAHLLQIQMNLLPEDSGRLPEEPTLRQACKIDTYRTPGQVNLEGDVGETVLPGATRPVSQGEFTGKNTPKKLTGYSVTVCLLYKDSGGVWHYSGYRYRNWDKDLIPVPNHEGWFYSPFTRIFLSASTAD